jgi:hypothetical protein
MRVIHWRGDSAFTSLFVRDNQMLVPLARDGGGPISVTSKRERLSTAGDEGVGAGVG